MKNLNQKMVNIYTQKGKQVFPKTVNWRRNSNVVRTNLGFVKRIRPKFETTWHYVGQCIYCGGSIETPTYKYRHPLTGKEEETSNCGWGECTSCGGV